MNWRQRVVRAVAKLLRARVSIMETVPMSVYGTVFQQQSCKTMQFVGEPTIFADLPDGGPIMGLVDDDAAEWGSEKPR